MPLKEHEDRGGLDLAIRCKHGRADRVRRHLLACCGASLTSYLVSPQCHAHRVCHPRELIIETVVPRAEDSRYSADETAVYNADGQPRLLGGSRNPRKT